MTVAVLPHVSSCSIVNAVIFEIPENGSDVAHLPALHSGFVVPSLGWLFSHKWGATWDGSASNPQRSHIADITVRPVTAANRARPTARALLRDCC